MKLPLNVLNSAGVVEKDAVAAIGRDDVAVGGLPLKAVGRGRGGRVAADSVPVRARR